MASIHSLPPELLHDILQLAYPHTDHRSHVRPGLGLACLVHSSWRPVAQNLMTETLSFHHSNHDQLRRFILSAPRGLTCRRLRFAGTAEDLVGLVERAQEGGITELVLEAGLSEGLFGLAGLSSLGSLRFETDFSPTEMNPDATARWSWPTILRHLSIDKATYPIELLTASSSTLTSLELRWTSPDQLPTVLAAAPLLTSLRTLSIHEAFGPLAGTPQAEVPPDLIRLINSFPHLSHLQLDSIYPAQLADILDALAPHNPDSFNAWSHSLGLDTSKWQFQDCFGLDPELLAFCPHPVKAVVMLFPVTEAYEKMRLAQDKEVEEEGVADVEDVIYFKQTIANACGTFAMLHVLANCGIPLSEGPLTKLFAQCPGKTPRERAALLSQFSSVESAHTSAAESGQTATPALEDDVDLHFVGFVAHKGNLIELDGRRESPINHGPIKDGLLEDTAEVVKRIIELTQSIQFNLVTLGPVPSEE